ncbi:hypothetical protein BBP40_002741 [Aspergillus hancockii]|nr:hypothetical protein BBP40_002741 [Aspergillus hancockii]
MPLMKNSVTVPSIHDRALGGYMRTPDGELVRCVGRHAQWVQHTWSRIRSAVTVRDQSLSQGLRVYLPGSSVDPEFQEIDIYEVNRAAEEIIAGFILKPTTSECSISGMSLDQFFAQRILERMEVNFFSPHLRCEDADDSTVERITALFDTELRYRALNDQWEVQGREHFSTKVRFFVSHNLKLQLCLPAFPCKSSNPDKVLGVGPDKGEEIALRRLQNFVQKIENIYPPGARILIVSDGHVFSDCIGVDDRTVDQYGARLKELNQAIESSVGGHQERVQFQSLVDLFNLTSYAASPSTSRIELTKIPELHHDLATTLNDVAETCRRILVTGCQPSGESLRAQIESGDSSTLALYRGFSRFMLEDLDRHPLTDSLSRSRRKKLAARVSFEMILRNQAYSNLVELMFPDHLRLSIHAHNNSGPKFGIRLFDTATVRAVRELDSVADEGDSAISASHLLHIPTPWHNCVAQVAGDPTLYIVKYGTIKEASSLNSYNTVISKGCLAKGEGAFVSLKRV